jgi:hypothetical protein
VFNFGRAGKPPSHPELLDWLAGEFMDSGWDMKAMHRLLMTSRVYRTQSSDWRADAPQAKADPDNVYLWRMNVRRMNAENVRDSLLALAGKLDPTMGGPEIDETKGQDVYRRSIYFRHTPDSIVPQQALALANSKLSQAMAEEIAKQLPPEGFIAAAFERVLGRVPTAAEAAASTQFLAESDSTRERQSLVHVLLNHNDFVTIR